MRDILSASLLPVVITLLCYQASSFLQKKLKLALFNPLLMSMIMVISFLLVTNIAIEDYQKGMAIVSWLMTPATVCLAIPMYQQFQTLRSSLKGILIGVLGGTLASIAMVFGCCLLFGFDNILIFTLLPKNVTSAIGMKLAEMSGGIPSITATVICITGILGNMVGTTLCKLFKITDPVAQGAAFGTASHVAGTAKASEIGQLQGAVSSLSLVTAGIITSILMPAIVAMI